MDVKVCVDVEFCVEVEFGVPVVFCVDDKFCLRLSVDSECCGHSVFNSCRVLRA